MELEKVENERTLWKRLAYSLLAINATLAFVIFLLAIR